MRWSSRRGVLNIHHTLGALRAASKKWTPQVDEVFRGLQMHLQLLAIEFIHDILYQYVCRHAWHLQ